MNKVTRDEVYHAIDTEREYQEKLWNKFTTTTQGKHSITEWLVFMEDYLDEAKHLISRRAEQDAENQTLAIVRKIAAMSVACMEQNGCSIREKLDPRRVMDEHGISIE